MTWWHFSLGFILFPMGCADKEWGGLDSHLSSSQLHFQRAQRLKDWHAYDNKSLWKVFFPQIIPPSVPFSFCPSLSSFLWTSLLPFLPYFPPSLSLSLFTQELTHWVLWKKKTCSAVQTSYSFPSAFWVSSGVHFEDRWRVAEVNGASKGTKFCGLESLWWEPASDSFAITAELQSSRWISHLKELYAISGCQANTPVHLFLFSSMSC